MPDMEDLKAINDFDSLIAYLRHELGWEIPEDLSYEQLTYSYTADELGLKLDAQVEITQMRPILGQKDAWGVFFVDFDKAELPVNLLRRILSSVSRKKRSSANASDRALFDKNDLLFVSAFGTAKNRRLALAHFHEAPEAAGLPRLRVLTWDQQDTPRHMAAVAERLGRLRWPDGRERDEAWRQRWAGAFLDRPREAIRTAKEMAQALAECAKQIRQAIEEILPQEKPGQALSQLFEAVKATLNEELDGPKFADTYAQTIAYGLLSKRIDQVQRWRAEKALTLDGALPLPPITVDALETAIPTNPFLSELLNSFMSAMGPGAGGAGLDFDELGLGDLVDLLNTARMEAVLDDFDKDKQGDDPVIHFYEGFLAAYDKEMKVQRGVFYTPKPVVSFIVRSVDEVLRTEFGLPLGLADTATWGEFVAAHPDVKIPVGVKPDEAFVKILDPATGTGTFLVEAIDLIHRRMTEEAWKGRSEEEKRRLWNDYVPHHLLPRLYGYELMMAPYAVAHMKIGLKLADTGYRFTVKERVRIYLTNALEPWLRNPKLPGFDALAHEAAAVNEVKRHQRFTVVIGNPPYAGISSNMSETAQRIVDAYRIVDGAPLNERKLWLQDDYVKFIRGAQTLVEGSNVGVFGYITNHGYLDNPTFRGMRQSLISTFSRLCVLDLHGNTNKKEQAPDGSIDKNVFDIRQGVAICLAIRIGGKAAVEHIDVWGPREKKYDWLSNNSLGNIRFRRLTPHSPFYFLEPQNTEGRGEYDVGYNLTEAMPCFGLGFQSSRDHLVVGFGESELEDRIENFIAPERSDAEVRDEFFPGKVVADYAAGDTRQWSLSEARRALRADPNWRNHIRPCLYRPFDFRVILYDKRMVDWPRPEVLGHMLHPNLCLLANRQSKEDFAALCANAIPERKIAAVYDASSSFPLYLYPLGDELSLSTDRQPNFSPPFLKTLATALGVPQAMPHGLPTGLTPEDIFRYIYAVLHSPSYRSRYAEFLAIEFPRLPLTRNLGMFRKLGRLGGELIALHLLDSSCLPDLLAEPKIRFVSNGSHARLGKFNKDVYRDAAGRVYLNTQNWFATVSEAAWNHSIGGYQPAQKWLKDRSQTGSKDKLKLGRLLSDEDILHYRRMIVALEETGKVMAEVDRVIEGHGGWPNAFKGMAG